MGTPVSTTESADLRIAVASAFGVGCGLWKKLADEGNDVRVYIGAEHKGPLVSHRRVGQGIVARTDSWYDLLAWAKGSVEPTIMLFDSSGLGKLADEARRVGVNVIGGGAFMDRLEKDRAFGQQIAQNAGCQIPPFMEFASLDDTLAFAKDGLDRPVYFKTDTYIDADATKGADEPEELVEYLTWLKTRSRANAKNILQEKIDGVALSTARWWNGRAWVGPYEGTFERKKFMDGEVGPSTGCSLNAVWFYGDEPAIARALKWDALAADFTKNEAPPGLYDINAIGAAGEAFFLEFTPRFGWDSEPTAMLLYDNLSEALWNVATGQGELNVNTESVAVSVRLSVPPYPWEHGERDEKGSCVGVPIRGATGDLHSEGFIGYCVMQDEHGLAVAAPEGIVGLSAAVGTSVEALAEETLDFAKSLRVPGLQFRTDAGACIAEDAERAEDEGFEDLPEGLTA